MKNQPSTTRLFFSQCMLCLLCFAIAACTADEPGNISEEVEAVVADTSQLELVKRFFTPKEVEAMLAIKAEFEGGLRKGLELRSVAYAYEQHAIRMRLNYFDKTPVIYQYPFNGKFDFSRVESYANSLPFMTRKCGFQIEATKEVVNYYCPSIHQPFFDYLTEIGQSSSIISNFAKEYPEVKAILPGIKQQMLMSSNEELDFEKWDHQLFYLLFHCWVNEELIAYAKVGRGNGG